MNLSTGRKCLSLLAGTILVGVMAVNCGGDTKTVKTDKLVVALEYTGAESNDGRDLQGTEGWQLRPQFETLIDVDRKTGAFIPMLATEWTVSPDGKSYDFKLRHGVQFQNGLGEMTAADVKFTYDHLAMRDATPAETARRRTQSVDIVNDYEVIIHERVADPSNIDDQFSALYHNGFIMSKKDFDARGDPKSLTDLPWPARVLTRWSRVPLVAQSCSSASITNGASSPTSPSSSTASLTKPRLASLPCSPARSISRPCQLTRRRPPPTGA